MAAQSLPEMLELFQEAGQFVRIAAEVEDPQEIAEITRRACEQQGPALFFDAAKPDGLPLVTNLLATEQRFCLALGVDDIEALGERLLAAASSSAGSWFQRIAGGIAGDADAMFARRSVRTAACQRVVKLGRDIDLAELDGSANQQPGRVQPLASAIVVSSDLTGDHRHINRCGLEILDRNSLAIRWQPRQSIAQDSQTFAAAREKMPIAIVLGGPPAVWVAAEAGLSSDADGLAAAGLLAGEPVDVVTCRTTALQVPAEAELVIEGHVITDRQDPPESREARAAESGSDGDRPTVEVAAVTLRHGAGLPAWVPLRPPSEQSQLRRFIQKMFLPSWRQSLPDLIDFDAPEAAPPGAMAFVSVRKSYAGLPQQIVHALWGQSITMSTKLLVVVDEHVDINNADEVWYHVARNCVPGRDVMFSRSSTTSDPAVIGAIVADDRMAIDATAKSTCAPSDQADISDEIRDKVTARWSEYGLP